MTARVEDTIPIMSATSPNIPQNQFSIWHSTWNIWNCCTFFQDVATISTIPGLGDCPKIGELPQIMSSPRYAIADCHTVWSGKEQTRTNQHIISLVIYPVILYIDIFMIIYVYCISYYILSHFIPIYPLVMTNSSPWKIPMLLISINHLFLWTIYTIPWRTVSHNQRVHIISPLVINPPSWLFPPCMAVALKPASQSFVANSSAYCFWDTKTKTLCSGPFHKIPGKWLKYGWKMLKVPETCNKICDNMGKMEM